MRAVAVATLLLVVVAVPESGNAQVYSFDTPPPAVTASRSPWQLSGEPLFHAGSYYYPAGPTVFFDGRVMTRTGVYEGVPLYEDATLEPFSIVYVPIGGAVMRPYERRREGDLAGTVGSRTPSFPIQRDVELSVMSIRPGVQTPALDALRPVLAERGGPTMVQVPLSTWEDLLAELRSLSGAAAAPAPAAPAADQPTAVESVRRPESNTGVWIDFGGTRWFSAGRSVDYDASRFEPVGSLRGFPVYRDRSGRADRIYVTIAQDGPVAPFERR